jgi:spoIIIJ-associated protein
MDNTEIQKIAQEEFTKLQELIGFEGEVSMAVEDADDAKVLKINVDGSDLGYMIGAKGLHLNSLQFIFGMMLRGKVGDEQKLMVNLDVGGYRKEREEKVEAMAMQKADDARILGDRINMPPMNSADRRIVHMTLQKFDDITTESEGEGRDRHVVIVPKVGEQTDMLEDDIEGLGDSEE